MSDHRFTQPEKWGNNIKPLWRVIGPDGSRTALSEHQIRGPLPNDSVIESTEIVITSLYDGEDLKLDGVVVKRVAELRFRLIVTAKNPYVHEQRRTIAINKMHGL